MPTLYVEELTLGNVGCHRHLHLQFYPGLIGIFGPNGSGKSTILNALYAAFTGDFSRIAPTRSQCVRAGSSGPSFVRVILVREGRRYQVRYGLRQAVTSLESEGEEPVLGYQRVRERLRDILGCREDYLRDFVFKTQDEIASLLLATDSERLRLWQRLFRLQSCDHLWQALGTVLSQDLPAPVLDEEAQRQTCEALELQQQEVARLEQQRRELEAQQLPDEELRRCRRVLRAWRSRRELKQRIRQSQEQLRRLHGRRPKGLRRLQEAVCKAADKLEQYRQMEMKIQRRLEEFRLYRERLEQVRREQEALHKLQQDRPAPLEIDPDKVRRRYLALLIRRRHLRRMMQELERSGQASCPTCRSRLTTGSSDVRKLQQELVRLPKRIQVERQRWRELSQRWHQWQDYQQEERRLRQLIAKLKVEPPRGSEQRLAELEQRCREAQRRLRQWQQAASAKMQEAQRWQAEWRAHRKQLRRSLQQWRGLSSFDRKQVRQARDVLKQQRGVQLQLSEIRGQLASAQQAMQTLARQWQLRQQEQQRAERIRYLRDQLTTARSLFHVNQLASFLYRRFAPVIEANVNRWLARMNAPLLVRVDPATLDFEVTVAGRASHHPRQLSGGQRVLLSIAIWLTTASLSEYDLGILALDEPTAHLDEDHRSGLTVALQALAGEVGGSRQVFIVTHAEQLKTAVNQVIALS